MTEKCAYNCQQSAVSSQQSAVSSQQSAVSSQQSAVSSQQSAVSSQQSAVSSQQSYYHNFIFFPLKVITSGFLALVVLSFGCILYYNEPSHYTDEDGVTDFRKEANTFQSQSREGFGYGWTNNEGYDCLLNYHKDMNIDVLMMGSSHMEAAQMTLQESSAGKLLLNYGLDTYNIAVAGQRLPTCASSLKAAVKKYHQAKFVVIETSSVKLTDQEITDIIHNRAKKQPAYDKGIISLLRRVSFFRLLYHQYVKPVISARDSTVSDTCNPELLAQMLHLLSETTEAHNSKLIIAYHPSVSLQKDGTLKIIKDSGSVKIFSDLCAENGIYFLDMSERFLEEYEKDYTLPYGFANSSVGKGHMNKDGHRMFADEIYKLIQRIEAEA